MDDDMAPDDDMVPDDKPCPHCGHFQTWRRDCWECGGEGFCDLHDEDPFWYDEDACEVCGLCQGKGVLHWCRECGYDMVTGR